MKQNLWEYAENPKTPPIILSEYNNNQMAFGDVNGQANFIEYSDHLLIQIPCPRKSIEDFEIFLDNDKLRIKSLWHYKSQKQVPIRIHRLDHNPQEVDETLDIPADKYILKKFKAECSNGFLEIKVPKWPICCT
jgi:HSP20 family molecular chaperone IbpA